MVDVFHVATTTAVSTYSATATDETMGTAAATHLVNVVHLGGLHNEVADVEARHDRADEEDLQQEDARVAHVTCVAHVTHA